jgi:hypothetical protein
MNLKQNQCLKLDAFGHTLEYFGALLNAFGCSLMRADDNWRQWSFTHKWQMHQVVDAVKY